MKKILIILTLLLVVMLSVAYAHKPEVVILDAGLTLTPVTYDYHPIDTPFFLHTNVYNTTNGVILDSNSTTCGYSLYSEKANWNTVTVGNLTADYVGMSVTINESFFNTTGDHSILIWCEYPTSEPYELGGFSNFYFTTYENEKEFNYFVEIVTLLSMVLLLTVAIATKNNLLGIITSIGLMIIGIYAFSMSMLIGIILSIGALLLALYFGFRDA